MTAITTKGKRRSHDFYPTTETWAVHTLLSKLNIPNYWKLFECCDGDGHISKILEKYQKEDIFTGDIRDKGWHYFDATDPNLWQQKQPDFTITNPPFNLAHLIVPLAYEYSKYGCAMLLRLSYLEPCENRSKWLENHPISKLIIMPRISFTGDGSKDSVTTAWFIWDKRSTSQEITVIPKESLNK